MGSYSESCALTGLPINSDDEVTAFVIDSDNSRNNESVSYDVASAPLFGKYDDYGSLKLDFGKESYHSHVLNVFLQQHIIDHDRLNDYLRSNGSKDNTKEKLSATTILLAIERMATNSRVNKMLKNDIASRMVFFHADILKKALSNLSAFSSPLFSVSQDKLENLLMPFAVSTPDFRDNHELWESSLEDEAEHRFDLEHIVGPDNARLFINHAKEVRKDSSEEIKEMIENLYLTNQTIALMTRLGRGWQPYSRIGSQNYTLDAHRWVAELALMKIDELEAARGEYYDNE